MEPRRLVCIGSVGGGRGVHKNGTPWGGGDPVYDFRSGACGGLAITSDTPILSKNNDTPLGGGSFLYTFLKTFVWVFFVEEGKDVPVAQALTTFLAISKSGL